MATMAGKQKRLVDALNSIIELDFDAVEAYEAAIKRVTAIPDKNDLGNFRDDHERHTRELSAHVVRLGGEAKEKADLKAVLTKGKVVLGGLVGDRAIIMAMKTNEDDTNAAYENILGRDDLDEELSAALHRNLSDERRHRAWMERRLSEMSEKGAQPSA